jgi:CHAT domain-containing protein/tetratricopeptide (TPR) repeat protein
MHVTCPRCHVPGAYPVRIFLTFPEDAGAILDLVSSRLNVSPCRVCSLKLVLGSALAVIDPGEERVAVVGLDSLDSDVVVGMAKEVTDAGLELIDHRDQDELRVTVGAWLESHLNESLGPVLAGDGTIQRDENGVKPHQRPLLLLTLARQAAGEFPPMLRTEQPLEVEEQLRLVRDLLTSFTVELVNGLYTHAFHQGGIATALELIEQRVPIECLDDDVLDALNERCIDVSPAILDQPARVDDAFRLEYLAAAAHVAARRSAPRAGEWAGLMLMLFLLSRSPDIEVPQQMLLTTEVLRRTIRFRDAWDVAQVALRSSPERLEDINAWFEHIGWGERYRAEWAQIPVFIDPGFLAELTDREAVEQMSGVLAAGAEKQKIDIGAADATSAIIRILARAGRIGAAVLALESALDLLADSGDWREVGYLSIDGASVMNSHMEYGSAERVLERHLDRCLDEDVGCKLAYSLVNEIGNVLRYDGRHRESLETYDRVGVLMADCEEASEVDRAILRRNRAIVLRELGSFDQAAALLEEALGEDDTDDAHGRIALLVSLARTYIDAGLPERALGYAEQAAAIPLSGASPTTRIEVLLVLVAAHAGTTPGVELPELDEALALAEELPRLGELVAAATLHHARSSIVSAQALARAHMILEDVLRQWDGFGLTSSLYSALMSLAEWELEHGNAQRTVEIVAGIRQALGEDRLPWQTLYLEARLPGLDLSEAWPRMRRVLMQLEEDVPDIAGTSFATPYMTGKADVQALMLVTLRAAIEAGRAEPIDHVEVFEFLNGREMRGRSRDGAYGLQPASLLARIANRTGARTRLLLVIEHEDAVEVLSVDPQSADCRLIPLGMDAATLRRASSDFSRRAGAACLTESQMAVAADTVEPVLTAFGELIARHATPGEHICVLPSTALLGLPVHAAQTRDGTLLLERHSFSVAANLSVIARALETERPLHPGAAGPALAVVCKQGDRPEYIARAELAAEKIAASFAPSSADVVRGTGVTKETLLRVAGSCEHLIFIGHGAHSIAANGRGLCVSADDLLPGAPLPVDVAPELRRFILDADDLQGLERTPAMVSSVACSSGRSFAGRGGTRLGLERALFAGGTRTILAPLWDVDHSSALDFLESFYESWARSPGESAADIHRRTCLEARERHGHLFLWAPMTLNGSWI